MSTENESPLAAGLAALDAEKADPFDRAKARALLIGYDRQWHGRFEAARVLAVEPEYRYRLLNPETGGQSQTFDAAGKIDAVVAEDERIKIVERKTTAESIDSSASYWDRLTMDPQISGYFLAADAALNLRAESILYDVIRKPGLQATDVPVLDESGLKIVIDIATGQRALNKNGSPRQTGGEGYQVRTRPMTPDEYEAKIAADITDRPDFYFAQKEVARLNSDILEYMEDAWAQSQEILYRRRRGVWPRNPSACTMMGTCEFFDLCAGHASVDGVRYAKTDGVRNPELETIGEADGRQLLTNSRLVTLRACPRRHQLRYEERIARVGEEDPNLKFGRLFHAGLEGWTKRFMNCGTTV